MDYRKLGSTGPGISPLRLRCLAFCVRDRGNPAWTHDAAASRPTERRAVLAPTLYPRAGVTGARA
ncbi:hypothetical protein ACMGDM_14885 [Sphingomonas sp. DT-51]|uniref:hypothetical protein n=1 Tax=Sphingomonas sp. DT-51 TaxID=3396165 RepID=UPI003F19C313